MSDNAFPLEAAPAPKAPEAIGFSVIVPVYNEAAVLKRFLDAICDGLPPSAEVVIALNGCSDASAAIVGRYPDTRIRAVEIKHPGKAHAIRAADAVAVGFPRFYVDADVVIRGKDLQRLAEILSNSGAMMISPRPQFHYEGASVFARAFNDVWVASPYVRSGPFQYVIGLSSRGRACWLDMPDVIADDTFMRLSVPAADRMVTDDVQVVVRLPTRFWSIVRVRRRIALGLRQLRSMGYQLREDDVAPVAPRDARPPLAKVAVYISGVAIGRIWALFTRLKAFRWVKDESSRMDWKW